MDEWKIINDYPDYAISNDGKVKSLRYNKILRGSTNAHYLYVNLVKNKKPKTTAIHTIVMEYFGPEKPEQNMVIDHVDGNKHNNHIDNLEWVTISENTRRSYGIGNEKRIRAKELRESGMTFRDIAAELGVSTSFVRDSVYA